MSLIRVNKVESPGPRVTVKSPVDDLWSSRRSERAACWDLICILPFLLLTELQFYFAYPYSSALNNFFFSMSCLGRSDGMTQFWPRGCQPKSLNGLAKEFFSEASSLVLGPLFSFTIPLLPARNINVVVWVLAVTLRALIHLLNKYMLFSMLGFQGEENRQWSLCSRSLQIINK